MRAYKSSITILFFFFLSACSQNTTNSWSEYTYYGSESDVDYYYSIKIYKTGQSKVKWQVKNNNSHKVMAGFEEKIYRLKNGARVRLGEEGWFVKPGSFHSFIADPLLQGEVEDIEIKMIVKK